MRIRLACRVWLLPGFLAAACSPDPAAPQPSDAAANAADCAGAGCGPDVLAKAQAKAEFVPPKLTFPLGLPGKCSAQTAKLRNGGTGDLHVTGLAFTGDTAFAVTYANQDYEAGTAIAPAGPVVLAAGAELEFGFTYCGNDTTKKTATLSVQSDDPGSPTLCKLVAGG